MSTTGIAEVSMASAAWADPTNYRTAARAGYARIIIHITSGRANPVPVAQMWQEPHHGTSAHFVIGQDGTVLQCVRLKDVAEHAHDANADSVGIEHCAREPKEFGPQDPGLPVSDSQYRASAKLVAYLLIAAGLQASRMTVLGHCEADKKTTHSGCPNAIWDWDKYMGLVQEEVQCLKNRSSTVA
jgi:N-acetyl-anhydromuramyl-L-alanine amidase AmpD